MSLRFHSTAGAALLAAVMLAACTGGPSKAPSPNTSSTSPGSSATLPPAPLYPAPAPPPIAQPSAPTVVPVPLPPLLQKRTQSAQRLQPQQIWSLNYEGKAAFYVIEGCCDRMNTLHDGAGYARCAPTGGLTGKGDRRCPAPLPPREQMRLVWEQAR